MVYVTEEYSHQQIDKINAMKNDLVRIRKEKSYAYENCGDGWHDNPSYHHLMAEERTVERHIAEETSRNAQFTVCSIGSIPEKLEQVILFTSVRIREEKCKNRES